MKVNPFKPNSPVSPGMFAGRIKELDALEKGLNQTKYGQPSNFLITGERGIGKSSIINFVKPTATGDIKNSEDGKFNFVTVEVLVSKNTTLSSLVTLIEKNLVREIGKIEKVKKFLGETWSFVKRIKVMDSGIADGKRIEDLDVLIDDFSYSLSATCNRITNSEKDENAYDGIAFLLMRLTVRVKSYI